MKRIYHENLCISGGMRVNFLCLILSENSSKMNPIDELNVGRRESIFALLKSLLGLWDSIFVICEENGASKQLLLGPWESILGLVKLIFGLWVSIFCLWESILGIWDSILSL